MQDKFVIAVASGKGGTGKTTVAVNLAYYLAGLGRKVQYLDCDVEEPNGHIFLKPKITDSRPVSVDIPHVDAQKCTACGRCGEICQYSAIVCIKEHVLTFEELCHSCGGCRRICPADAIEPRPLNIGQIELGSAGGVRFVGGRLRIGSVRTVSLIKEVKKHIQDGCVTIVDVPPGTSCPVVEAVKGADFVLLVTEPTPFGLNDLKLAVGLVREMKLAFGVLINRDGIGNDEVEEYCKAENIETVMRLPDDRRIAEEYSSGRMIVNIFGEYKKQFAELCEYLQAAKEQIDEKRRLRIRRKNIS
ncbi:MAG TPA: ATP-binding protein [Sedimentisphaerales bacterium]|nr:ATP-binding protein [Sedimentisphaerales bacterium]